LTLIELLGFSLICILLFYLCLLLLSEMLEKLKVDTVELMPNKLFYVSNYERKFPKTVSKKYLFEKIPLIYREPGSATRNAMEGFIEKNNYSVNKKMELTSNEAVKQAVISGLGCSIMPLIGNKNALKNNELKIIPVRGLPITTTWNLIWLKSKNLSPVAVAFLNYLKDRKENIIQKKFSWIEDFTNV